MKHFLSAAVCGADSGDNHAAEAVRHLIQQLISAETTVRNALSDGKIIKKLHPEGIDAAHQ